MNYETILFQWDRDVTRHWAIKVKLCSWLRLHYICKSHIWYRHRKSCTNHSLKNKKCWELVIHWCNIIIFQRPKFKLKPPTKSIFNFELGDIYLLQSASAMHIGIIPKQTTIIEQSCWLIWPYGGCLWYPLIAFDHAVNFNMMYLFSLQMKIDNIMPMYF